mgnify:CR=1 FL=1
MKDFIKNKLRVLLEGRLATSKKLKGRKLSQEQIEKIRLSKLGKSNSKKGKPDGPKPNISKSS